VSVDFDQRVTSGGDDVDNMMLVPNNNTRFINKRKGGRIDEKRNDPLLYPFNSMQEEDENDD